MAKNNEHRAFSSLQDLVGLLGTNPADEEKSAVKLGYDGKPQMIAVQVEKRRGKGISVVRGFQTHPKELEKIAQDLKKLCAAGGSVLDNALEIQGDHEAKITKYLQSLGFSMQKSRKK